jgi:ABC-type uncharacterized transport system substrate-binding protein
MRATAFPFRARKRHMRLAIVVTMLLAGVVNAQPKCLFVSSYHQGYAWSDGVERGLRSTLDGHCELRQFDMDTKRKKSIEDKQAAAMEARQLIDTWRPDVVITADDNAAKYLIQPFFRDADTPFVFCGINWTAKEYGFPYSNATGMIEVAPVQAMVEEAQALVPNARRTLYIGANTATEKKNADRLRRATERLGLVFEQRLASSLAEWIDAYSAGQDYDFIIIGSNAGINDWDNKAVREAILPLTRRLTVTSHTWMMPVSMLGMTKVPEEQGEWAGQVALQILAGAKPHEFPIVANRKWDLYLNQVLLNAGRLSLPAKLQSKGKVFE